MPRPKEDTYSSSSNFQVTLEALLGVLGQHGASRVYVKALSPNDNSKNQIYLGGDFSALNIIPVEDWKYHDSTQEE